MDQLNQHQPPTSSELIEPAAVLMRHIRHETLHLGGPTLRLHSVSLPSDLFWPGTSEPADTHWSSYHVFDLGEWEARGFVTVSSDYRSTACGTARRRVGFKVRATVAGLMWLDAYEQKGRRGG